MDNSNQSKTNRNSQQTFTVKFIGTQSFRTGMGVTSLWTLKFNEPIEKIKEQFVNGNFSFFEIGNIDKITKELYLSCFHSFDNEFYGGDVLYIISSDVWIFDENRKIVGVCIVPDETRKQVDINDFKTTFEEGWVDNYFLQEIEDYNMKFHKKSLFGSVSNTKSISVENQNSV